MSSPRGEEEEEDEAAAGAAMAELASGSLGRPGDTGDELPPLSCPSCRAGFKDTPELSAHMESCCPDQPACSSAGAAITAAAGQETVSCSSASSSSSLEARPESPPSMDVELGPLSAEPGQEPAPPLPPPPLPPPPPPPTTVPAGHLNIPLILEELRVLQQRQLHQMQMTEQICRQVLLLGSLGQVGSPAPSAEPAPVASVPPKPPLPVFSIKTEPGRTPASGSPEVPKPAFFHLYHPFPGGTRVPKAEQLLAPAFPTATGLLAAQCLGAARGLEQATSPGLLRPKNGSGGGEVSLEEKPGGRHKCRFCGKVFGSDSALQIHLRSHTGERPYKCNICGNRFTTRGNLKVHFHRHREKYPHVQMNPHPVPEHLDYVLTTSGLPYGMSVPPEKAEAGEESAAPPTAAERKALSATESLTLLSGASPSAAAQALPSFNKLVLMKAVEAKGKGDENTPPEREAEGARLQLGKLVGSLPSWALLANHFKAGAAVGPFPYVLEASPSETSKLQQLVEKIDRQASPSSGAAPVTMAQTMAGSSSSSSSLPAASGPNQCVICLRVLSCPRALQLHYGQHGGERPFKCKICGRAFSTRGNLRAHFVGHKTTSAARAQNSCPICQKKFTNAVTLQQHVRMHLGGQIPNGALLPESPTPEGAVPGEGEKQQQQPLQPPQPQDGELSEEDEEEATDEDSLESGMEKVEGPSSPEQEAPGPAKEGEEVVPVEEEEGSARVASPLGAGSPPCPTQEVEEKTEMEVDEGGTLPEEAEEEQGKEKGAAGPSEKPQGSQAKEGSALACGICKQAFPDRAALRKHALTAHHQVNMASPVWSSNPAQPGQRLPLEGPVPVLSGGPVKLQDFLGRDIPAQLVGVGPLSFWNQYTAFLSGGLPAKPAHGSAASASSSAASSASNMAAQGLFGSGNMLGKAAPVEAKEKPATGPLLLLPPPPAQEGVSENQGKGEK